MSTRRCPATRPRPVQAVRRVGFALVLVLALLFAACSDDAPAPDSNALEDLNNWLASDEENSGNYILVAEQLMATGDKFDATLQEEALMIIDKAIKIDPDHSLPYTVRARINLVSEKLDDAVADANRAVELDEENVSALMVRATIYSEQDKLDEALKDVANTMKNQIRASDRL